MEQPRHEVGSAAADIATRPLEADPAAATAGPFQADRIEGDTSTHEAKTELLDRAKQLGRSTLDLGAKMAHTVEERMRANREIGDTKTKKPVYMAGAGAMALAGTVITRRHRRHTAPTMSAPKHMAAKAKEKISSLAS
jgi:hypothetical protein